MGLIVPKLPSALVVLDEPFYQKSQNFFCPLNWWRFGDHLAVHFDKFALFVPMSDGPCPANAQPVKVKHLKIYGRFFFQRNEDYYSRIWTQRRQLLATAGELFSEHELIILRTPSPAALLLAQLAWNMDKPTMLFVAGNILTATSYAGTRGLKAKVARLFARRLRKMELTIARQSKMVAAWGEELLPIYRRANPQTILAADPILSEENISERQDTCGGPTVRIVRVARILPNKGLEYLIKAVAELRRRGRDIKLDVAGGEDETAYKEGLLALTRHLGIAEQVKFHGQVEFGPVLFDLYRQADIHVVSSISEGLPRCIVEGRAFGLPTIATNVGGIPTVFKHQKDGILISPRNSEQIVEAVERIIDDCSLRQKIIQEGYKLARLETAEFQAARLAGLMAKALRGQPLGEAANDLHLI